MVSTLDNSKSHIMLEPAKDTASIVRLIQDGVVPFTSL